MPYLLAFAILIVCFDTLVNDLQDLFQDFGFAGCSV